MERFIILGITSIKHKIKRKSSSVEILLSMQYSRAISLPRKQTMYRKRGDSFYHVINSFSFLLIVWGQESLYIVYWYQKRWCFKRLSSIPSNAGTNWIAHKWKLIYDKFFNNISLNVKLYFLAMDETWMQCSLKKKERQLV